MSWISVFVEIGNVLHESSQTVGSRLINKYLEARFGLHLCHAIIIAKDWIQRDTNIEWPTSLSELTPAAALQQDITQLSTEIKESSESFVTEFYREMVCSSSRNREGATIWLWGVKIFHIWCHFSCRLLLAAGAELFVREAINWSW